jgi:hypothetical protein
VSASGLKRRMRSSTCIGQYTRGAGANSVTVTGL